MGIKTTFTKKLPLSVFELLTYQYAKTPGKYILWRNRIILPNTYIFSVLDHIIYKKHLNTCNEPYIWETKEHYEKHVL